MRMHDGHISKHTIHFAAVFFSCSNPFSNGEDKLSKLALQILTGKNWWSLAAVSERGAPKHTRSGLEVCIDLFLLFVCLNIVKINVCSGELWFSFGHRETNVLH